MTPALRGEADRAAKDLFTIEQHLRYCKRTSVSWPHLWTGCVWKWEIYQTRMGYKSTIQPTYCNQPVYGNVCIRVKRGIDPPNWMNLVGNMMIKRWIQGVLWFQINLGRANICKLGHLGQIDPPLKIGCVSTQSYHSMYGPRHRISRMHCFSKAMATLLAGGTRRGVA